MHFDLIQVADNIGFEQGDKFGELVVVSSDTRTDISGKNLFKTLVVALLVWAVDEPEFSVPGIFHQVYGPNDEIERKMLPEPCGRVADARDVIDLHAKQHIDLPFMFLFEFKDSLAILLSSLFLKSKGIFKRQGRVVGETNAGESPANGLRDVIFRRV